MKLLVKIFYIFPLLFRIRNTSSSLPLRFLSDSSPICRTRKLSFPLQRTVGKVPSGWRWPFQQTNRRRFAPAQKSIIMAIVNGTFATNFSKRLGKVSFANRQGQNIARQRPASVKNPMTEGQQNQRMIFTTVQAAYKKMGTIADHSFEGYSYGAKSMARFMKLNLKALKGTELGVNFKGNTGIVAPNNFVISEGSLPSPMLSVGIDATTRVVNTEASVGEITDISKVTVAQFLAATGTKLGQQLTFVSVANSNVGALYAGDLMQPKYSLLKVSRVILKTDLKGTETLFDAKGNFITALLSENSEDVSEITFAIYAERLNWKHGWNNAYMVCAAVILSEKQGTTWARSSEVMAAAAVDVNPNHTFEPSKVINTYNPKSSYYLNNATV